MDSLKVRIVIDGDEESENTKAYIENINNLESQISKDLAASDNYLPSDVHLDQDDVYFMYFYYIFFDRSGQISVRHYKYWNFQGGVYRKINFADRFTLLSQLAANARLREDQQNPRPSGANFQNIVWEHRSFVGFLFDHPQWDIIKNSGTGANKKTGVIFRESDDDGRPKDKNICFFNGEASDVDVSGEVRTGYVMLNYHCSTKPNYPPPNPRKGASRQGDYKFDILFRIEFATQPAAGITVIFDPTGSNSGQTQPPPGNN